MTAITSFADFPALPDHTGSSTSLSSLVQPSATDLRLGFTDGYPLILIFIRGFFCPRDQQQLRSLVAVYPEIRVNYSRICVVSVDPSLVNAAFRAGLGAEFTFLSDVGGEQTRGLGLLDVTEGEYAGRGRPFTFVLDGRLAVWKAYDGWFFVGRPTVEELRKDLRNVMSGRKGYDYEAWTTADVMALRIPAETWAEGAVAIPSRGGVRAEATVAWFDYATGNGALKVDGTDAEEVLFNFTAIPGSGYRTVKPGDRVEFELITTAKGRIAFNIQPLAESD
ncbi:hypothetical protein HK101_007158 [Irineochytrium annulatum]|nr:hypothetical protein HK101_007158 [Irineochytrium annulatum]